MNLKILDAVNTAYAPKVFKSIIEFYRVNILNSLDLAKNYLQIKKIMGNSGGKSGEFFFNSYDNKLIIKTLSQEDVEVFKKILADYHDHLVKYPSSLIA